MSGHALPPVVTLKVSGRSGSASRTDIAAASHALVIDEPLALGGGDAGPTPVQTLLAAWLGCLNVMLHRIADARGIVLGPLALQAEASLLTAGVQLAEQVPLPLRRIELALSAPALQDVEQRAALLEDLHRYCPISTLLRSAGVQIVEGWTERGPAAGLS
ncbi:MAG: OsmC family protein [Burkholderiaceae bacterium]